MDQSKDQDQINRLFAEFEATPVDLTSQRLEGPVVLVGAGKVGRQLLGGLRRCGIEAVAFTDNNPTKWGQEIEGTPIVSPAFAGEKYGAVANFIVAIGNLGPAWASERDRLQQFGARKVTHFSAALKHCPELWPLFFLEPRFYRSETPARLRQALNLFREKESRRQFIQHLRWRMLLDETALPAATFHDQYFPNDIYRSGADDVFVDVGAYDGDTLAKFLYFFCERFGHYHAFEPDPTNFARLASFVDSLHHDLRAKITSYQIALSDRAGQLNFAASGTMDSHASNEAEVTVPSVPLDELFLTHRMSVLKIDVEGYERETLRGAAEMLRLNRPVIALAIYHSAKDLHELPLLIAEQLRDYSFYLRSHGDVGIDTVLYAIPYERHE